jgi:hypothetical protein
VFGEPHGRVYDAAVHEMHPPPSDSFPRHVVSERLFHGCLQASVADIVDAGIDLLPDFELAAIPVLDSAERPGEWPLVKRRLRAEGIRFMVHRGVLLLEPGELDQFASVGMFSGSDELLLCTDWNDEFEAFPGRITSDVQNFEEGTPLGLEEWMIDAGCLLAMGDGAGLNYAALDGGLADRLSARFRSVRR